jgi:hypothetical protein
MQQLTAVVQAAQRVETLAVYGGSIASFVLIFRSPLLQVSMSKSILLLFGCLRAVVDAQVEPPKGDALRSLRHLDHSGTSLWWRCNVSSPNMEIS